VSSLAWVLAMTAAGAVVGGLLARSLAPAEYRIDAECRRPLPRALWSVTAAVPLLWAVLTWHVGARGRGAVLPAYLLLAAMGVVLTRIDLDVHRLPEGLTLPTAAAVLALLAVSSVVTGDWGALGRALACAAISYAGYWLLALGDFGAGDVTLGGVLGLALGYLGWESAAVGVMAAFLVGGLVSLVLILARRITVRSAVPFGPFLLLGALAAVLVAP
jgi:leader peptidase (prepilin peptidase)/N-methyltransferase